MPRSPTPRALALAALLAASGASAPAHAFELASTAPSRDDAGQLWVQVRIADPLEDRVERSLGRGMPATLELHAELWRRRGGWFDRMERTVDATLRLRYDVWSNAWLMERAGAPPYVTRSLDSLETALSRPLALPVAPVAKLADGARYYVSVTATLRPLKVEDVEQVEGWLSGEVDEKRGAGLGMITSLPRSLFDAVRNFAGLGDQRARAQTADFTIAALPVVRR